MKCLSLRQPWATLVVFGKKRLETRSWATQYRGVMAVHAAKGMTDVQRALCRQEPFLSVLESLGYTYPFGMLPRGGIIGTVEVVECHHISNYMTLEERDSLALTELELAFGDYREGRFAWELKNPRPLKQSILSTGRLGCYVLEPVLAAAVLSQLEREESEDA